MTSTSTGNPSRTVSGARPTSTVRVRKRPRHPRRLLLALLAFAVLAAAGWLVWFSPVLATRRVEVAGVRALTAAEVRAVAAVPLGTPMVRLDVDAVAARVVGLRPVRSVQVVLRWPDTVRIDVQERTAVLAVRQPDGFVLVDEQGAAYRTVSAVPKHVVPTEVDLGNQKMVSGASIVAAALTPALARRVQRIRVATPDSIRLELHGGRSVFWGSADESDLKAQVLLPLLTRSAASYDVSAPLNPALR